MKAAGCPLLLEVTPLELLLDVELLLVAELLAELLLELPPPPPLLHPENKNICPKSVIAKISRFNNGVIMKSPVREP